jgi:hypothetical protein
MLSSIYNGGKIEESMEVSRSMEERFNHIHQTSPFQIDFELTVHSGS